MFWNDFKLTYIQIRLVGRTPVDVRPHGTHVDLIAC